MILNPKVLPLFEFVFKSRTGAASDLWSKSCRETESRGTMKKSLKRKQEDKTNIDDAQLEMAFLDLMVLKRKMLSFFISHVLCFPSLANDN